MGSVMATSRGIRKPIRKTLLLHTHLIPLSWNIIDHRISFFFNVNACYLSINLSHSRQLIPSISSKVFAKIAINKLKSKRFVSKR